MQHYFCFSFASSKYDHLQPVPYRKETLAFVNTRCRTLLSLGRQLILSRTPSIGSFRPSQTSWCHFPVAAHCNRWHLGTLPESFKNDTDFKLHSLRGNVIDFSFFLNFRDYIWHVNSIRDSCTYQDILVTCSSRCWSLKFKQSDHQFLHQSNVFHHINNILSKSDDGDSEESFNISVQSGYEAMSQARNQPTLLEIYLLLVNTGWNNILFVMHLC